MGQKTQKTKRKTRSELERLAAGLVQQLDIARGQVNAAEAVASTLRIENDALTSGSENLIGDLRTQVAECESLRLGIAHIREMYIESEKAYDRLDQRFERETAVLSRVVLEERRTNGENLALARVLLASLLAGNDCGIPKMIDGINQVASVVKEDAKRALSAFARINGEVSGLITEALVQESSPKKGNAELGGHDDIRGLGDLGFEVVGLDELESLLGLR